MGQFPILAALAHDKRHRSLLLLLLSSLVLLVVASVLPRSWAVFRMTARPPPRMYTPKPSSLPIECAALNDSSINIDGCLAVDQACVDQGEVVMMGEEYQYDVLHPAWAPGAVVPLPSFVPTVPYTPQYGKADSNGDFFSPGQPLMDLVPFRVRSWLEANSDLQNPQYDNSTIPVVFHAVWQFNYAHVATASLAWIWNNINQSSNAPLVERARLVVRTPHGWAMPPFMRPLFQPLLRRPVTTFAELSQRPGEGVKTAGPRCYCRLLFCNSYGHTYTPNAWSAAQAVAASYQPPAAPAPAPTRGTAGRAADTEQRTVRRIVFHRRAAQTRQFLNLPELLERCSQWSLGAASASEPGPGAPAPQLAGSSSQQGQPVGAAIAPASALEPSVGGGRHSSQPQVECSTHAFKDLADSIATAREASVFVGTHGANIANGMFMIPGSAIVEVMHPDWAHTFHYLINQDPRHELIYFGLIPPRSAFSPGIFEEMERAAGLDPYNGNPGGRDKNVHLRWEWLEPVLDRIAALDGNVTAWRQLPFEEIVIRLADT